MVQQKFEVSTNNTAKLASHKLVPNQIFSNNTAKLASHNKYKLHKFHVEDFLRVPDKCNLYSKGYTANWNR